MEGLRQRVSIEHVLLYIDTIEAAGRSPCTIEDYRRRLLPFVSKLHVPPTNLDIRDHLDTIKSVNNRSVTLVVIRQFFRFLRDRDLYEGDPTKGIPLPKARRRNYPPIAEEEFVRLVDALRKQGLRVLAHVLYYVGCRVSEAVGICAEHVFFEGDFGTIEFPCRKGEVDGFAAFGPEVSGVLKPFMVGKSGPLFPYHRVSVHGAFRRAGKMAGIPGLVTPHRMRHAFIQRAVDQGWQQLQLQKQLGHSSPLSTAWYFQATRHGLMETYKRIHEERANGK